MRMVKAVSTLGAGAALLALVAVFGGSPSGVGANPLLQTNPVLEGQGVVLTDKGKFDVIVIGTDIPKKKWAEGDVTISFTDWEFPKGEIKANTTKGGKALKIKATSNKKAGTKSTQQKPDKDPKKGDGDMTIEVKIDSTTTVPVKVPVVIDED